MLKRNSKSFLGIILVVALVFSMLPVMPASVAHAAATNLLPSNLTLNGNIKASSQQSTRLAVNVGNSVTWTLGANTVFSATYNNLWVAIDLGSSSDIKGLNFQTSADDAATKSRGSQYEISYSNDASANSPWNKLPATPNNNPITFSPTANGWTSAAVVPTTIASGTIPNGTYSWKLDGKYFSTVTFTNPITARYILINYTLNPSPATGQLGIGQLRIIPPVTLSSASGSFYRTLQNTLSTQANFDTDTDFAGITNGSYTLVQGTDYTVDANNVVTFSNNYLNSLANGNYNLSFNFSSSQGPSTLPYVLTVAAAADSSLSPQGAIYIPASPSTVSTALNFNGNTFKNISDGTTVLSSSAYTVSGDGTTVTFNQSYLDTLSMGTHAYTFNFNQGMPQTFMITISGKPPAAGIDYRYWTLQEPLTGGAGQTSQTLQAGYADPYFYIGTDGSQVFMDTAVGGTTSGSAHPRSELREYDPLAGKDAGWLPAGANVMTNNVAVAALGTLDGVGWTTIGQVFDNDVTTLCELEYGYDPARPNSNIRILYEPEGRNEIGYQYLPIKIPLNQYFTYRMTLNDGVLKVYINGSLIFNGQTASNQVIPPAHKYYFKAGNYDQTAKFGDVNYIPYTVVQFKSINVYHTPTVSSNADLNSLALSNGTLSPSFASGTTVYTSNVANSVSSVTVTANVYDTNAMLTVNGTQVVSGQASGAINLNVGSNVIPIVVTAEDGTTKAYNVTVTRADMLTANSGVPIAITDAPVSVTVPSGVTNAKVQVTTTTEGSNLVATLPNVEATATTSLGNVSVAIPEGTKITAPSTWDGTIKLPEVQSSSSVSISNATVSAVIEVGSADVTLTFDKAVRLLIPSQGGKSAGYVRNGVFTPISGTISADTQAAADNEIAAGGEAAITVGGDLVIWTKHFTKFASYTPVTPTQTYYSSGSSGSAPVNSGTISAANGGTIAFNGVKIDLPAGAGEGIVLITVDKISDSLVPTADNALQRVGDAFEIKKSNDGDFSKPVVITLPYDKSKVNLTKSTVSIYGLDEQTKKWMRLADVKVDSENGTVSGSVKHFGKFAVLASDKVKSEQPQASAGNFTDLTGHWAEASVLELVKRGAINGYPDNTFKPNNQITRAEFVSLIVKAFNLQAKDGKSFADTQDHWAKDEIATAAALGVVTGYDESTFGPDEKITREQMAVIVVRAAKLGTAAGSVNFSDSSDISDWARAAMASAVKSGLIGGYEDGTVKPQANTTRGEAATILLRALQQMK
ncbi:S-layer homology domain-containing protein [Paenibacillus thalictri]|uniref:Uncharacterized protein n=1 Tax=Paenibacillus thalictri TaxID=2527873 RepID=A0A4Q9DHR7_9BACL|nr:S-layer homology domain-containing protein [Paenibacillus thalictri]TBL71506.1 hypothetical protein EYB31_29440 [Paenibacillus thalictri]